MKFLFSLPKRKSELSDQANDVIAMATLSERLAAEQRQRVAHISGKPENVAEHSLMLIKVASALAQKYYPKLDISKVVQYAALHDDVEAYVGDTPTGEWCDTDYDSKASREDEGLQQLKHEFSEVFPDYVGMVEAYEQQEDPESRFVRMIDKVVVAAIQVTDGGQEARKHFTPDSYVSNELHGFTKHKPNYPELGEVLDLKMEIAQYVADNLLKRSEHGS